jgi:hypothetical protein
MVVIYHRNAPLPTVRKGLDGYNHTKEGDTTQRKEADDSEPNQVLAIKFALPQDIV